MSAWNNGEKNYWNVLRAMNVNFGATISPRFIIGYSTFRDRGYFLSLMKNAFVLCFDQTSNYPNFQSNPKFNFQFLNFLKNWINLQQFLWIHNISLIKSLSFFSEWQALKSSKTWFRIIPQLEHHKKVWTSKVELGVHSDWRLDFALVFE